MKEGKIYYWVALIVVIGFVYVYAFGIPFVDSSYGYYKISKETAKSIGPSANLQWQNAMKWARENTSEDSIFVHWWDYGYFVETMGERRAVTDGGHSGGNEADHNIGRYILTTPNPLTAMSYMKTWDVDYLLIDPTEMGKYGAFSKIGSNDSWDRVSSGIFGGVVDDSQMQETKNGVMKVYQLGGCVDSDISYKDDNGSIFLPGITISKTQQMQCNSYILGMIVEFEDNGSSIKQPEGVFQYRDKQYRIPLKNVFVDGEMKSFENGVDSVVYFIPRVDNAGSLDPLGAMIYLSPRTYNSLMGKLYILGDPFNEYPLLTEADFEDDPVVSQVKQMLGSSIGDFIWMNGIRAPLKIWKVDYEDSIPIYDEFKNLRSGKVIFGGLDYLFE